MRRAAASRESLDLGEEAANGFSGNFHNLDDARQESAAATAKGRSSLSMRHRVAKSSSFAAADRDAVQYTCFFAPESVYLSQVVFNVLRHITCSSSPKTHSRFAP